MEKRAGDLYEIEDESIGQDNEDDIVGLPEKSFSEAVLWGTDWTVETITSQLEKGNIELMPDYQRREAWRSDKKSRFIESIILQLPIPQIILAERKDKRGSYMVIDGKQRLLTMMQFSKAGAKLGYNKLKLDGLISLTHLNGLTYEDIEQDTRLSDYLRQFDNHTMRTTVIRNWPDNNYLYAVFYRLNVGSVPLSPQELRQALIPGPFVTFAGMYTMEQDTLQKALRISKPDFRMRDVELLVRHLAFRNFIREYRGNMKVFLDSTCERLNATWAQQENTVKDQSNDLELAIDETIAIFGRDAFRKWTGTRYVGAFNRPVFDIMTYFLVDQAVRERAASLRDEVRNAFQDLCKSNPEFLRSLETDRKSVV